MTQPADATKMPKASALSRPVSSLFGVGPERAELLKKLDILSVEDLLLHRPRRYEDRRRFRPIADLQTAGGATTRGIVVAMGVKWFKRHTKSIFEIVLDDGTARLHCRWWNLPFMEKYFKKGDEVVVFGKLESVKPRTMDHPETEVIESGEEQFIHFNRITPVYPMTEGLTQRWMRGLIWRTLGECGMRSAEFGMETPKRQGDESRGTGKQGSGFRVQAPSADPKSGIQHPVSSIKHPPLSDRLLSLTRTEAIRMLHFPEETEDAELARQRLALDEFVEMQRQIRLRRTTFESKSEAFPCGGDNHLIKPFLAQLGFRLTEAQTAVLRQLRKDMAGAHPMRRLLQGDVGSGKTVVAACCALMALESGYEVALMAPTEILAEQHFGNFKKWFGPLGIPVELLTGSRKTVESPMSKVQSPKSKTDGRESGGEADTRKTQHATRIQNPASSIQHPASSIQHPVAPTLFVGTHALIESGFAPEKLGLVIIDEQHKFGVSQREQLLRKGHYPHLLVMTATPIPRTLGLTVYGDLDISLLGEMPPGRGRVRTFVRTADRLPKVWAFIRDRLKEGRQALVIYPRVEDTGQPDTERGHSCPQQIPNDRGRTIRVSTGDKDVGADKNVRAPLKAVTREFENVQKALEPFRVGLLHGRLPGSEKEKVTAEFRSNEIQVLLATSLVEVGLDVPNATIMLIENAEQFGLAQLHQMRGRIGRGPHDSYCILVAASTTTESEERLRTLEETTDGFRIAETDLALRGPGELLGHQQSGAPRLRFGDLSKDWLLIKKAREIVTAM